MVDQSNGLANVIRECCAGVQWSQWQRRNPVPSALGFSAANRVTLSKQEVADQLGVGIQTCMRWEHSVTEPGFSELKLLAEMLGKQLNDFAPPED